VPLTFHYYENQDFTILNYVARALHRSTNYHVATSSLLVLKPSQLWQTIELRHVIDRYIDRKTEGHFHFSGRFGLCMFELISFVGGHVSYNYWQKCTTILVLSAALLPFARTVCQQYYTQFVNNRDTDDSVLLVWRRDAGLFSPDVSKERSGFIFKEGYKKMSRHYLPIKHGRC